MYSLPLKAQRYNHGFSLVELLITLAIMGVIAACTIPSLFQTPVANQTSMYSSKAKDTALMIVLAYEQYRNATTSVTAGVSLQNLTPYLNYATTTTTDSIDWEQGATSMVCGTGGYACYKLHNGGTLHFSPGIAFGGTSTTNAIYFYFDPDGRAQATTNGPGKSILFWLYADGTIKTWGNARSNTNTNYGSIYNACSSCDPPWFLGF